MTDGSDGVWGGFPNAFVTNCVISGNSANGASDCNLYNCTLTSNGGYGAFESTLYHCTLIGNGGGGAFSCTLYNCAVTGNQGGGADGCTLYHCTLTGNTGYSGGGASGCTLYDCTLTGNSAAYYYGGGADQSTLYNCTLTGNSAASYGGGAAWSMLYNCIVYFNTAPNAANYESSSTLNYCCTTPQLTNGVGNITNSPLFVDYANGDLRLQSNSPCINAGNNAYMSGTTDLDGNPRIVSGTVDIGAYEFQGSGSVDFLCVVTAIWPAHGRLGGLRRPGPRWHEQLAGVGLRHQSHQCAVGLEDAWHRLLRCPACPSVGRASPGLITSWNVAPTWRRNRPFPSCKTTWWVKPSRRPTPTPTPSAPAPSSTAWASRPRKGEPGRFAGPSRLNGDPPKSRDTGFIRI